MTSSTWGGEGKVTMFYTSTMEPGAYVEYQAIVWIRRPKGNDTLSDLGALFAFALYTCGWTLPR